jgi:methyl-accepting chemotaxis protein
MLKKFNLKIRMVLSICSVAFFAFAVTIAFVAVKSSNMAKNEAIDKTEQIAYRYSGVVKAELEVAMDAARTTAQVFEGIKNSVEVPQRQTLDGILKQLVERNPNFIGVWTCWEPNALDNKDAKFAGKEGHDNTGRFIPYWNRGGGKIIAEPLAGYDQPGDGDYYLLSQRTGNETILDPYEYTIGGKKMLITSVVAPIKHNNKVVGVAGIDIALTVFKEMISGIKPFETGYGFLTSNIGTFVGHPKNELIGKNIKDYTVSKEMMKAINQGTPYSETKKSVVTKTTSMMRLVPVQVGYTKTPWSFAVVAPMDKVLAGANSIMYTTIFIGIIALLILITVVFFIAKSIADPMIKIVAGMDEGASQVASAAGQVSSASQSLAEGSSEQAASIEETSSSMEEMSSMTMKNAENAGHANNLMQEANQVVGTADNSMGQLTTSMEEISKASEETSKIIKTIDEIAFQTNLLALNAAVEAARAGEAGAGFAVVADEVRNLAMRAADAAKNTSDLIEGTMRKVGDGSELVAKTNKAFGQVAESSGKVGELVAEISEASSEQSNGIEQVNTAINEMDKVVQQNAANAEESASASEEMSAQAETLKEYVEELVTLVTGKKGNKQNKSVRSNVKIFGTAPAMAKKSNKKTLLSQTNEVKSDQVIPFDDDDDFKDF